MIKIKFKIDWKSWIRKKFCKNEVPKGKMIIIWRDWDDKIYGWTTDKSDSLPIISRVIDNLKVRKMEEITGMNGGIKGEDLS